MWQAAARALRNAKPVDAVDMPGGRLPLEYLKGVVRPPEGYAEGRGRPGGIRPARDAQCERGELSALPPANAGRAGGQRLDETERLLQSHSALAPPDTLKLYKSKTTVSKP